FPPVFTQLPRLAPLGRVVARLSALGDGADRVGAKDVSGIQTEETNDDLAWDHLTLRSPHDGRVLVHDLSVAVPMGLRVLVTGPSEAARIALFRATAGL